MAESRQLFVAGTTYHTFLACGIAMSQAEGTLCDLVVTPDFEDYRTLTTAIERGAPKLFHKIELLADTRGPSRARRHLLLMQNIARTARIARSGYDRVHVFNEERPEAQAALYWAKRARASTTTVCVEDGLAEYRSIPMFRDLSLAGQIFFQTFYGWWWRPIRYRGGSEWADRRMLSYPDAAPDLGLGKPIDPLPEACFDCGGLEAIARTYAGMVDFESMITKGRYGLVLLMRSDRVRSRSEYGEAVRMAVRAAASTGIELAVKHHPREPEPDPFGALRQPGVVDLPRGLAAEFLFAHPRLRPRFLIGDMTTAMTAARRLLPETLTVSIAPLVGREDSEIYPLFKRISIPMVSSVAEIQRVLGQVTGLVPNEPLRDARISS